MKLLTAVPAFIRQLVGESSENIPAPVATAYGANRRPEWVALLSARALAPASGAGCPNAAVGGAAETAAAESAWPAPHPCIRAEARSASEAMKRTTRPGLRRDGCMLARVDSIASLCLGRSNQRADAYAKWPV